MDDSFYEYSDGYPDSDDDNEQDEYLKLCVCGHTYDEHDTECSIENCECICFDGTGEYA